MSSLTLLPIDNIIKNYLNYINRLTQVFNNSRINKIKYNNNDYINYNDKHFMAILIFNTTRNYISQNELT